MGWLSTQSASPPTVDHVLLRTHAARPSVGSWGRRIFGGYIHLTQTELVFFTLLYHDVNS